MNENTITAFDVNGDVARIITAPVERPWMEETPQKYAYRCLPLNIANGVGWQVLSEIESEIVWSGGHHKDSVRINVRGPGKPYLAPLSHFGSAIITFHINALFRTPPGTQLLVTGPTNMPLHGLYPLSGIVETSWSPFTFTMNWLVTKEHETVVFPKDFPVCQIIPLNLTSIEQMEPEIRSISSDPALNDAYLQWCASRTQFNTGLQNHDPETVKQGWQKNYFRGNHLDGSKAEDHHRTKVKMKEFEDRRGLPV